LTHCGLASRAIPSREGKSPTFIPSKKAEIDLKIKLLEEEAKAREVSPYCAKHFPNGGVRCQDCLNRQLTPEQRQHRDVQATLFGTPLPVRPFEIEHADRFVTACSKRFPSGAITVQDIEGLLTAMGYKPWAIVDFIKHLRTNALFKTVPSLLMIASNPLVSGVPADEATSTAASIAAAAVSASQAQTSGLAPSPAPQASQATISGYAGIVNLHDIKLAVQNHPPRLVSPANVDGMTLADLRREFDAVDLDKSGGISRYELQEMLFVHGMEEVRAREFTNRYFEGRGKTGENDEITFSDFYNGFMENQRKRAFRRVKRFTLKAFADADADGDGWLDLRDVALHAISLLGVHVTRDRVPDLFAEIDVAQRGKINLQELFEWYCKQMRLQPSTTTGSVDAY